VAGQDGDSMYFIASIKKLRDESVMDDERWLAADAEIHCVVFADRNRRVIATEVPSKSLR